MGDIYRAPHKEEYEGHQCDYPGTYDPEREF